MLTATSRCAIRSAMRITCATSLITEPQIPAGVTLATPLSSIAINRHEIGVNSVESYLDEQLDMTAHFQTGFIRHDVVAGIEAGRETSDPTRPTWTNVPTTSLLDPNPDQTRFPARETITSIVHTTSAHRRGVCARHHEVRQALGSDGRLPLGPLRHATIRRRSRRRRRFNRVDEMPSWRAALVYKPVAIGQHSTSMRALRSIPRPNRFRSAPAPPACRRRKTGPIEFGTKWDFPHNRLSLRAAVFQTDETERARAGPNQLAVERSGRQRSA